MLRFTYLLLLFCVVIGISSCDKDDDESYNNYPFDWDITIQPEEDFYLIVEVHADSYHDYLIRDISVISKQALVELRFNNREMYIGEFQMNHITGYYDYHIMYPAGFEGFTDPFDTQISYELILANKTVSGSLQFPSRYTDVPIDYTNDEDFYLSWELANNPGFQELWVDFQDDYDNHVTYYKELSESAREHTMVRNLWSALDEGIWTVINLAAFNYEYQNGGMICYISDYETWGGNKSKETLNRQRKDRIGRILSQQIVLPK